MPTTFYVLIREDLKDSSISALGVSSDYLTAELSLKAHAESLNTTPRPVHSPYEDTWRCYAWDAAHGTVAIYTIFKTHSLDAVEAPQPTDEPASDALYKQSYNGLVIEQERIGSQDFWLVYDEMGKGQKRGESRTWAIYKDLIAPNKTAYKGRWDKLRHQWIFQRRPPQEIFDLVEKQKIDDYLPKEPYFPVFQNNPAYDLIPRHIEMPRYGDTDGEGELIDKIVRVRLFGVHDYGAWTWYISEYSPDTDEAFGFVYNANMPDSAEWGKISIRELHMLKSPSGLPLVERDLYFGAPKPLRSALLDDNITYAGTMGHIKPATQPKPLSSLASKPEPEPQPDPLEGLTLEEKLARTEFVVVDGPEEIDPYIGNKKPEYPRRRHDLAYSPPDSRQDVEKHLDDFRIALARSIRWRKAVVDLIGHRIGIDHDSQHHQVIRELMEAYVAGEWSPEDQCTIYLPTGYRYVKRIELIEMNGNESPIEVEDLAQAQTVLEIWQARGVAEARFKAYFDRLGEPISGSITLEHDLPHNAIGRAIVRHLRATNNDLPLNVYMPKTSVTPPPAITESAPAELEAFTELDW